MLLISIGIAAGLSLPKTTRSALDFKATHRRQ